MAESADPPPGPPAPIASASPDASPRAAPDASPRASQLPAVLGFWDAAAIVAGSIIGSGVFLKASTIAQNVSAFGPILLVWIAVGLVTLCGAVAVGELSAMYPRAGGPYLYLRAAFGRLPAFLWGWTEFWVIRTASVGALATATVLSLAEVIHTLWNVEVPGPLQAALTVAVVLILTTVNVLGAKWGAWVQNITVIIKVSFLLGIISLPWLLQRAAQGRLCGFPNVPTRNCFTASAPR